MIFTSVVQSLKCPSCEFQLKIGDSVPEQSSLPDECEISEEDCYALHLIQMQFIRSIIPMIWSLIPNSIVDEQARQLELLLSSSQGQKSVTKYQFDYKFQPEETFYMGAVAYCRTNDYCIIEATEQLLRQLYSLRKSKPRIRKELQSILLQQLSYSNSRLKCYYSLSNRNINCADGNCFIGIRPLATKITAGCTAEADSDEVFVSTSFSVTNNANKFRLKGTCEMLRNRDLCNTISMHDKLIKMARDYVLGQ
ncbi:unnamed protein product [Adineta ricciae]|uniref:Uncharacterized protein n=1 Tax=Adineta ricciae TaxID=249248 RepID=A0A815WU15_ADIRI|nr:unnamed protein product [Adineta ricciae]CAF1623012.1 unnamed protein product [Adineta ricciae]